MQGALERQFATNRAGITFPFLNNLISPYLATAQEVDLALIRNRTQANLSFGSLRGFAWGLEHKHENRNGNRPYGASFGFSALEEEQAKLPAVAFFQPRETIRYRSSTAPLTQSTYCSRLAARASRRATKLQPRS